MANLLCLGRPAKFSVHAKSMLTRQKSACLLAAFRGAHISGFTRAIAMSSQFSGCGCFPGMLVILSEFNLLPHGLIVISTSCCCTFGPFVSSSCRVVVVVQNPHLSHAHLCSRPLSLICAWAHSHVPRTHQRRGKTERHFQHFWPAPGGLRLEELPSISFVGRHAHTSVRS